mmetsp:Transcript_43773/g.101115  ORF Transcript_43773/g.101115 Transcript_43773/m.101115 type:complete len:1060 (-) Transcript_43773:151-3330(-)
MRRVPKVTRPREHNLSKFASSRGTNAFNQLQEELQVHKNRSHADVVTNGALDAAVVSIRQDIAQLRTDIIAMGCEDAASRLVSFGTTRGDGSIGVGSRSFSKGSYRSPKAESQNVAADATCEHEVDAEDEEEQEADKKALGEEEDEDMERIGTLNDHHSLFRWPHSLQLRQKFSLEGEIQEENEETLNDAVQLIQDKGTNLFPEGGSSQWFLDMPWPQAATVKEAFSIEPDSPYRLTYDVSSMWVLVFELLYMPYSLTWSIDPAVSNVLMFTTTTFWLLDMCLSFITGYNTSDGRVEMKHRRIAVRYLKTWFAVDFSCVTSDLLNMMFTLISGSVSTTDGWASFLRVAKLARFLRILSVVRSIRIVNACNHYLESRLSEAWRMMVRILELAFLLVWIGHLVACFWFQIGRYQPDTSTGESWLDFPLGIAGVPVRDQSRFYQYVTSYHWGLAQITLGAHDVNPVNSWERLFVICINLFGLLFGGTLVSVLSTTLIDLREMNQERHRTLRDLKAFLLQNEVLVGIRMRCFVQVNERLRQREAILAEKDVTALDLLSVGLCRELRHDLYSKYLLKHPLLITWSSISEHTVIELCSDPQGLEFVLLLTDDELFTPATPARGAYCILEGSIEYKLDKRNFHTWAAEHSQMAEVGQWISEASWWCKWLHVGTAQTANHVPCKLLCLTPENMARVMLHSRSIEAFTRLYANSFYQCIIKASADSLPTDLKVHYTGFGDLVFAMPSNAQILIGYAAIKSVWEAAKLAWVTSNINGPGLQLLMDEVWNGKATVVMDGLKSLQRHVSLVVLALQHEGKVLVEMAEYDAGEENRRSERKNFAKAPRGARWKESCRLPAVKQTYGELPHEAVQRLITNRLEQLQPVLVGQDPEEVVVNLEVEPSAKFGVDTKYCKARCILPCEDEVLSLLEACGVVVDLSLALNRVASDESLSRNTSPKQIDYSDSQCSLSKQLPNTLYVLSGTSHTGVYAWMTMAALKQLSADKQLKENILQSIQSEVQLPGNAPEVLDSDLEEEKLELIEEGVDDDVLPTELQLYGITATPFHITCIDL